jgi:ribosomal protein S18 acetylase RimI-like enzyme
MTTHNHMALRRVAAYLRARMSSPEEQRVASFSYVFDAASAELARNYAIPDDGADPCNAELAALCERFDARQRVPRLEYIHELAPAVLPRLTAAGFTASPPLALMSCSRGSLTMDGDIDGLHWSLAENDADLHAAAEVQNHAYGVPVTKVADLQRLRELLGKGGAIAVVRASDSNMVLGAGLFTPPHEGVAEIAAIGIHVSARRRGIGAALAALLADHALVQGIDLPFLMCEVANEDRVYRRAGFERFGEIVCASR